METWTDFGLLLAGMVIGYALCELIFMGYTRLKACRTENNDQDNG